MSLLLVMFGGALGAGARYLVARATPEAWAPGATLAVNLTGGLLMGCLFAVLARTQAAEPWRLFLGVGVLGGFTTFSAFSLDAVTLAQRGELLTAAGYVLASVVGSIAALLAGLTLVRVAA
ncbi:fluoride efflux transporter CrcB [Sphingomonas sp.]|jgi:CrcB protein|uniref:fluoride efflux transporter CrcB n=1 Tax=Sphingomonas sp. TaxID=28214 RepID=UPI002D80FA48|nr:fluoride efflux transporter CrcB [Sphingomonas sp.]HEU0043789.1 fluoride efflux transporter CrcB [Sphingomonas sp.]